MPSVKTYFEKTGTVPVSKSFFLDPIRRGVLMHTRAKTRMQIKRNVRLAFPCPVQVFQDFAKGLDENKNFGVVRMTNYDGSAGRLKPTMTVSSTGAQVWEINLPPGRTRLIDALMHLEDVRKKTCSGAARLLPPRGAARVNGAKRMAMVLGPCKLQFKLSNVRCLAPRLN